MGAFFSLAMQSAGRQAAFRRAVVIQLLVVGTCAAVLLFRWKDARVFVGQLLLVAGIVQGAMLVGWRLTQMPKSQSLEFLLASPLRPARVFLAEAFVGLGRLALVLITGTPILVFLIHLGYLESIDLPVLTVMPFTWGAITGLGLTAWAYESIRVRTWCERILGLGILIYLGVGVLVGEKLQSWLGWLPPEVGRFLAHAIMAFHHRNPFGIMRAWMLDVSEDTLFHMLLLEGLALIVIVLLLGRSASRLREHFQERHYRPLTDLTGVERGDIGNRPLSWWAVRRVMEYSGRANLWLAGGFGVLYAAYTMAGPHWPSWLGKIVFVMFGKMGGIPVLTTAMVVLAAVPAAFQYGLWDSNTQDRCRRLELLLLTDLDAEDYWNAAAAAAWRRGRGYFFVALMLWFAGTWAGQFQPVQLAMAVSAGVILWGFYFVLGFRAFSRGLHSNGLGTFLTMAIPMFLYAFVQLQWLPLAALLPPGSVYLATSQPPIWWWLVGPTALGLATLMLARAGLAQCDDELHQWYEQHHGKKI